MNMVTGQSEDIIQDTKKYIIGTARHLFSEFSYIGVSMNDIAQKLNITKAALYYHFSGKAEIYEKVLDDVFSELNFSITQLSNKTTIDKKLHQLIKNYLDFGFKEKNLIKALMLKLSPADNQITKHIAKLREQVVDLIQPIIKEVSESKNLTKRVDDRLLASLLTSMMDGLLLEYSFFNKKIDSAKVASQIIIVLF